MEDSPDGDGKSKLPDEAPPDQAKEELDTGTVELVSQRTAPIKIGGMVALADSRELSITVDELAASPVVQKLILTRALGLEGEVIELKGSNAALSAQLTSLRSHATRLEGEVKLLRRELGMQKETSRTREVFGGLGLAALSAGLGLVVSNLIVGSLLAGVGALVTGSAFFVTRSYKHGSARP